MADEKLRSTPKKSGGNRREGSSEAPRPTMAFRVNAGLYESLKGSAQKDQLTITEEIERRLTRSFDFEAEIAAKDRYIAALESEDRLLRPDKSARVFGNAVAMALSAVRYTGGKDWRDDDAVPAIMAGVVRRIVDHCNRTRGASSTVSELVYPQRIASTIETVSTSLATYLDEALPALPPLQPQDDPANWTGRARGAVVFRDRATGNLVKVVQGAEYDIAEHEAGAEFPAECSAAIARYTPQRGAMDVETFNVYPLKDRSSAWHSLSRPGRVFVVPEGQGAPPAFEPALAVAKATTRPATPDELARMEPAPGLLPPSLNDRTAFDDAVSELPLVKAEKAAEQQGVTGWKPILKGRKRALELDPKNPTEAPAPKRRGRAKTTA